MSNYDETTKSAKLTGFVMIGYVVAFFVNSWIFSKFPDLSGLVRMILGEIILMLPFLLYLYCGKDLFVKYLNIRKTRPVTYLYALLFVIVLLPEIALLNSITMLFETNVTVTAIGSTISGNVSAIAIIAVVSLLPGILEELAYRGLMYSALKSTGRFVPVVFLSAFLFGLSHGNLNQFFYAFFIGIVFCYLVEASGTTLTSIMGHLVINAIGAIGSIAALLEAEKAAATQAIQTELGNATQLNSSSADAQVAQVMAETSEIATWVVMAALAVVGVIAAYRILIRIAVINEREEDLARALPKFLAKRITRYVDAQPVDEFTVNKTKIFSLPLVSSIILLLALMVVYELLAHGVLVGN